MISYLESTYSFKMKAPNTTPSLTDEAKRRAALIAPGTNFERKPLSAAAIVPSPQSVVGSPLQFLLRHGLMTLVCSFIARSSGVS